MPTTGRPRSAGRGSQSLPEAEREAVVRRLLPRLRGRIARRRAQGRPCRRCRRRCWSSSTRNRLEELAALGTSCPDHFLRTKIRPLVVPADADDARARPAASRATAQDYAGYYERCRHADSPAMRDPNAGGLPGARRRHADLRPRQGHRPDRRPSSTSTRSTSCAAPPASTAMSACPSRRRSTSSTGCSRRRSCSACPSPRRWPGGWRWSPAVPAGSAGRWRAGCWPRAPASC